MREHHEDGALVCAVFSTYVFDNDWFLDTQDGFGHLFYPGPSKSKPLFACCCALHCNGLPRASSSLLCREVVACT